MRPRTQCAPLPLYKGDYPGRDWPRIEAEYPPAGELVPGRNRIRWTLRILSGLCVLTFSYVWTVGQTGLNATNKNLCELWNAVWPWPWQDCTFHTAILVLWAVGAVVSIVFLITEFVRWLVARATPAFAGNASDLMRDYQEGKWQPVYPPTIVRRMPLTDLLKMAAKLDWNFTSDDSLHLLDMQDAIRQGGLDGTLKLWGKLQKWSDEGLMRHEVLERIPRNHWSEFRVTLFGALEGDNFNVKSWSPKEKAQGYLDLHVERDGVSEWLKRDAIMFKGRTKSR